MSNKVTEFLLAAHEGQVQDKDWLAGQLAKAEAKIESDAKVIAALREALAPFAASAYDRDGLPPDWEIGTPLRHLREARSAIAAADERLLWKRT